MLVMIAGRGALPGLLSRRAAPGLVAALEGFPPDGVMADVTFRVERLGSLLADLVAAGATEAVFAGAIRRPELDPALIDEATRPLVPRIMAALGQGDDAALRTVIAFFEEAGIAVRAVDEFLPELLPPAGSLTRRAPGAADLADIERGMAVLDRLGPADVGQSCIVRAGQVLAIEGAFGTDWMLESFDRRPDGRGGLLVKAPKPGQDRRIDLPTIGPDTVSRAAAAGLDGIAVAAGGVLLLDRDDAIRRADDAGLFLEVR